MLERFKGKEGKRLTVELLRRQRLINGSQELAIALYEVSKLQEFEPGQLLITENSEETDLLLILTGEVRVEVHGRLVASRIPGQHVGEMSLIHPGSRRSASVTATEKTVCAAVSEAEFSKIAKQYGELWRELAIELAEKLRQRGRFLAPPNETPEIFIGCSREMLPVAEQIQRSLAHKPVLATLWTDSFFRASSTTIESLLENFSRFDFAIIVLGRDDIVISRSKTKPAPRDNVVFELGLAMGALSRQRTFIVYEEALEIKIPSDLLGVTPITYRPGTPANLATRIAPVATQIQLEVESKGPW